MFSIGDFSLLARVSRRLLRHCEILGLLRPGLLNESSGERGYSAAQLPRLNRIVALRELGFTFPDIARLVDHVPPAELRGMLLLRRCAAGRMSHADIEAGLMEQLLSIETRIAQIEDQRSLSAGDVTLREEPARRILCMREPFSSFAKLRAVMRTIADNARRHLPAQSHGPLLAVSHSREFELEHMDVQLGVFLQHPDVHELRLPDSRRLSLEPLPGVACMAVCVRTGLAEHAHLVTARLARFIEANGYRLAGPSREVCIDTQYPATPEHAVIEMQFPITRIEQSHQPAIHRPTHVSDG